MRRASLWWWCQWARRALFLSGEGALLARLPAGELASTVGAGDAMVAGLAAAVIEGAGLERTARLATAFAVAKLGRPGRICPIWARSMP
jgi:1-phosphofructokinase